MAHSLIYIPETITFRIMKHHQLVKTVDANYIAEKLQAVNKSLNLKNKKSMIRWIIYTAYQK